MLMAPMAAAERELSPQVRAVCTGQGTNEMVAPTVKAVYEKHGGMSGRGWCCHFHAPLHICVLMRICVYN